MGTARYVIIGRSAAELVRNVEDGTLSGALRPGEVLPSVRGLARHLELSPTTVAAAYRELRRRGVIVTQDRSRTLIAHRPDLHLRLSPPVPEGTIDLATGNPDPQLLPDLAPALHALPSTPHRYTDDVLLPELADLARRTAAADGLAATPLMVVGGGLDGIQRVLEIHARIGDRVAVEDPGYPGCLDLIRALGLEPVSLDVDDEGPTVDGLEAALTQGVVAVLVVPRAQNPTGAALSAARAEALTTLLHPHPDVVVIEDDHAAPIAGAPPRTLTTGRSRWAVVRSVSKWLGPQLRVAVLVGDAGTVSRVLARQRLGAGWVSQLLQQLVATTWSRSLQDGALTRAAEAYAQRRTALLTALAGQGITASGTSGLNVWIPVEEEVPVVHGLATRGWAVAAGESFRLTSGPAIRITVSELAPGRAEELAADLDTVLADRLPGRRG